MGVVTASEVSFQKIIPVTVSGFLAVSLFNLTDNSCFSPVIAKNLVASKEIHNGFFEVQSMLMSSR